MDISNALSDGNWESDVDVAIVGAGGAGLVAALEACCAGAQTVIFEKQSRIWESSTAISVGRFSFAGTDIQTRCGIKDSNELLIRDVMEAGQHLNDPELVDAYAKYQLDTYHYLKALGVKWSDSVNAQVGMSVPRGHLTDPLDLVRLLRNAVEANGGSVVFGTPVTGLVVTEDGRVLGVLVREKNGATVRIRARRGVVLACGGFARSSARLASLNPKLVHVVATSGSGHTGDGLAMAEALGARTRDLDHIKPSFELHVNGTTSEDILLLFLHGGIIVNRNGDRFVNESISYKDTGMACLDQPGQIGYQIIDGKIVERAIFERQHAGASSPLALDAAKLRLLIRAETIEHLAEKAGLPPRTLRKTIERYNDFVDKGHDDDFGRRSLAGNYGTPVRIDTPPFYACPTISHMLATYGGIAVNADMRVTGVAGPIPGLFAAGEIVGGFHGASYQSGTALGKALIFGRIAGRNAAYSAM